MKLSKPGYTGDLRHREMRVTPISISPVDSAIYRRDWPRFQNAFSQAGWGLWGSKMTRWFCVRIDHVLASNDWRVVRAWLGPRIHSDHRPLIADLRLGE